MLRGSLCRLWICLHEEQIRPKELVGQFVFGGLVLIEPIISNPMLGETFEDSRTHFIAEKVVHNPLVMAYHAHGKGWELNGTSSGKTKFWGM